MARCWPWAAHAKCSRTPASSRPTWAAPTRPATHQARRKDDRMSAARPPEGAHTAAEGEGIPSIAARPPEGTPVRLDAHTAADDQAPMLGLQNVESAYGPIKAIRGISLQVRRGQIATVLGSNGAGKTTILKTISGIMAPLRGSIGFQGCDITARDPAVIVRRGLVHVPEGREGVALLSVRDNVMMGAYTRSDRDAVARDLERVYGYWPVLRERAAQHAGLLSGGQQQMLALARALMANPALILLDEPSLGLSPKLTREIFEIVVRINRERGTTVLLVEQNAGMALDASDYGYVLENGLIVTEVRCERLREKDDIKEFYLGMKDTGEARTPALEKEKTWR